ncbi:hypothetical protein RIF29_43921 [Crotalaria pallida]|uniref:non-specific serine/threonine protein kinase n=1 Tax=Crotalaria pallida TaxID=3830 RepID=A0AAN9DWQ6_CROPI
MSPLSILFKSLIIVSQFLPLVSAHYAKCPPSFDCEFLGQIKFPFTTTQFPDCGVLAIRGCEEQAANKSIQVSHGLLNNIINVEDFMITVTDNDIRNLLLEKSCKAFSKKFTLPPTTPLASFYIKYNITIFSCIPSLSVTLPSSFYNYTNCSDYYNIYYGPPNTEIPPGFDWPKSLAPCSRIDFAVKDETDTNDPFMFLSSQIQIQVQLSEDCNKCLHHQSGKCHLDSQGKFYCAQGIGLSCTILIGLLIIWHCKKRNVLCFSSNPYPENGSVYFGVPLFSYKELEAATKNFDRSRELGDGGFGTVYYGKLQDGREVAVKRLYENNYKRVEQFMNEIKILTLLRHENLVSLYGCTSRHSRELLLVYEYISNGTVASHLRIHHQQSTTPNFFAWPIRMKVAIETATALAYLHASDIIHRDVKTNNILLDNNFCVKVADFGLSRLFPIDVTHVSTAPQGTPGYVDPEYHQCYQLTSKSDVYSFGVVLIELISSMPAVDMTRHKDEINLANFAIRKIQKSAIGELVDPSLGFEADSDVRRKIVMVAELAFQCLQRDKELRPTMDEVLEVLMRIESGKGNETRHIVEVEVNGDEMSNDDVKLLKSLKVTPSPKAVTDSWESESTTPNVSGNSQSQI